MYIHFNYIHAILKLLLYVRPACLFNVHTYISIWKFTIVTITKLLAIFITIMDNAYLNNLNNL